MLIRSKEFIALKPFIPWAGGKTQLLPKLISMVPHHFDRYYEPFIGAGAFFLALQPDRAVISDLNWELINAYFQIRDSAVELIYSLKQHIPTSGYFYHLRSLDRQSGFGNMSELERASRFIWLMRTCFNGLHRVNKKGQMNMPVGDKFCHDLIQAKNLLNIAEYLNSAEIEIRQCDWSEIYPAYGDFVYADPPYDRVNNDKWSYLYLVSISESKNALNGLCETLGLMLLF